MKKRKRSPQTEIRRLRRQRKDLMATVARMRKALDDIYNFGEREREAVIKCYGLHHVTLYEQEK